MRIGIFGGSFDPVHREHVALVGAAIVELGLDRVFVVPSGVAPHKPVGAIAGGTDRLAMCRIAFSGMPAVEVCDWEVARSGTSYTYLTVEEFSRRSEGAELFLLVGEDMLEDFFGWRFPERILSAAALVACGRGGEVPVELRRKFSERFERDFLRLKFVGEEVSSTDLRVRIAFGKEPKILAGGERNEALLRYISERGLYAYPAIAPALALEKEERREHSFRVALMACARARSLFLSESKVLLAAALHDCGKYVPLGSELLRGFVLPADVPEPVVHQYTGAYLAEHAFGIADREILDAIRYHASGKEGMSEMGKLIYLADLLEPSRDFSEAEELRALFWRDLGLCLRESLRVQLEYLKTTGKAVYELTERAYLWYRDR